jgi:hypothetical protein
MDTSGIVAFYLPGEVALAPLLELDPDTTPEEFQTAQRAWTLQTFLRLRSAGLPVELTSTVPKRGIVVFHAKHKHDVQEQRELSREAVLVSLRGDRNPVLTADFEILQNTVRPDDNRTFGVPHWPQPGLVPRDPSRGVAVRVVAYKGFCANLDPAFLGGPWLRRLADLDVVWRYDAASFDRRSLRPYPVAWSNYAEVDLIVAVRPHDCDQHAGKPASKLINAWRAGVPALLGPERAYRALRRNTLDYCEVTSPREAAEAVRRLRAEPALFRAMIANGRERAREFGLAPMIERWRHLLFEVIPAAAATRIPRRRQSTAIVTASAWLRRLAAGFAG